MRRASLNESAYQFGQERLPPEMSNEKKKTLCFEHFRRRRRKSNRAQGNKKKQGRINGGG
jgi:hypothetical protein